jgi:hypothetical protein
LQKVIIDAASPTEPWIKSVADLDGDGLPDLIVGGASGPLVWYQAPNWTKRTIAPDAGSEGGSAVGDIDGDGDIDVVVGKTWYENVGGGTSWIVHALPGGTAGTYDIVIADVNGDGKPDIIMRGKTQTVVTVFLQVSKDSWTTFDVDPGIGLSGLDVADVDGDGYPDIVVGGVWMENPKTSVANAAWKKYTFGSGWNAYGAVKVIDIDRDGRPDIVLSVSEDVGKLSWFKAPANPRTGPWTENVIDTSLDHVHGFAVADIDKDGSLDVAASESAGTGRLIVYTGNGGASWVATEVGRDSLHNLRAADVDGDGDIDLFGVAAIGVNPVILYRNVSSSTAGRSYSTNFAGVEDPITESGQWIGGKTVGLAWADFQSMPGLAYGKQNGWSQSVYDDSIALLTGTWGPNQTVQATVKTVNQDDSIFEELEIRLRSTISANRSTGYECLFSARSSANAYVQIVRWNGAFGDWALLDARGGIDYALRNGDTIKCTISGSTITAYINGVQKLQVTDSRYTTGNPGIGAYLQNATGVNQDYGFTSFAASDQLPP